MHRCYRPTNVGSIASRIVVSKRGFASVADRFDGAQQRLQTLKESPGNDVKLKLYALFKQATVGQVNTKRPGMTNFVGRAKWDAWNSLSAMTQVLSKHVFCALQYKADLELILHPG